jgi:glucosamine--fructose-6-phosphate aminotransferase (isomerizing)
MSLHSEIYQQPEALQHLLDRQSRTVQQVIQAIQAHDIRYVYLAARGSSEHAGIYGQYLLGACNGLAVALAAPSLFTVYRQPPRLSNALVIGVSQSGQSPDIVSVLAEGQRQGALTLAITNDSASPLAQAAHYTINISAGPEQAVAATKTYTAQLLTFAMLASHLTGAAEQIAALHQVPAAVAQALTLEGAIQQALGPFHDMRQCVVLGRGYNFATALEWALKLKELVYVMAERYSTAEFQHGPIAIVNEGFPVLAVLSHDANAEAGALLLQRLASEQRAQILVLGDYAGPLHGVTQRVQLAHSLPAWLTPISNIVPAQLFCYYAALAAGHNPDTPRGLNKVTLTR